MYINAYWALIGFSCLDDKAILNSMFEAEFQAFIALQYALLQPEKN